MTNTKETTTGNGAKMREALIDVVKRLEARVGCDHHTFDPTATTCDGITSVGRCGNIATCTAIFKARAALAAPPRNCDVGTVEGQTWRYNKFCCKNKTTERSCGDCPAYSAYAITKKDCRLAWAQMPYEEGGVK